MRVSGKDLFHFSLVSMQLVLPRAGSYHQSIRWWLGEATQIILFLLKNKAEEEIHQLLDELINPENEYSDYSLASKIKVDVDSIQCVHISMSSYFKICAQTQGVMNTATMENIS